MQGRLALDEGDDDEDTDNDNNEDEIGSESEDEEEDDDSGNEAAGGSSSAMRRWIRKPSDRAQPYMISTTSPTDAGSLLRGGIIGALGIGALGVLVMAWLIWMRFG